MISRVDKQTTAAEIVKEVGILKAIRCIQEAWVSVSQDTICKCLQKCGVADNTCAEVDTNDEEFVSLVNEIKFEVCPEDLTACENTALCYKTPFETCTCKWQIHLCEETHKSHIISAKEICIYSDESGDEAEHEE